MWFPPGPHVTHASRSKNKVGVSSNLANVAMRTSVHHSSRPLSRPEHIDAKERFSYRYVDFSATLSETGLTSKTIKNNQIRAFRPMHAQSHRALSTCESCIASPIDKLTMDRRPLTAHQSESNPALRQCSAQGH